MRFVLLLACFGGLFSVINNKIMEIVTLNLNFRGRDILVNMDLETANILLNDPEELGKCCNNLISLGQLNDDSVGCSSGGSGTADNIAENGASSNLWLSKGRPSEQDVRATEILLMKRLEYDKRFDDRKSVKMQLWQNIANDLANEGFNIDRDKQGPLKCRQKFSNLTRTYLGYIKHMKTTGAEKINDPPFYNEMCEILGYKVDPQNLQDSFNVSETASSSHCSVRNRFCNIANTVKPKRPSTIILEEIKKQHNENLDIKEKQLQLLQTHTERSLEQNERLISLMEKMVKKKGSD